MDLDDERRQLHDALVDAALLPTTGPFLARAAFRLRSAVVGSDRTEIIASVQAMQDTMDQAHEVRERVPGELRRAFLAVLEWMRR